ncbi:MAG: chemotaxis protein CheW, partial [bacterium]
MADESADTTNDNDDIFTGKYLMIRSGSEEYGFPVQFVDRVREYDVLTDVPESSPSLRGAMNLQGEVVPVLDLQVLLSLGK